MRVVVALVPCALALGGCGDGGPSASVPERAVTVREDGRVRPAPPPEDENPELDRIPGARRCDHARVSPSPGQLAEAEAATRCLIDAVRRERGLAPLEPDPLLAEAAEEHSIDMVRDDYFAHVSPEGRDLVGWVRPTGWIPAAGGWTLAENIGWGERGAASPLVLVDRWLESPSHRRNILARDVNRIGVGIQYGVPVDDAAPGAVYTTIFGAR